jgi:hypothetical protein
MRTCCFWIVGFLGAFYCSPARSQSPDDTLFNETLTAFRNIYFQEMQGDARLYQGSRYDVEEKKADGYPYFQADLIRQGSVTYQGTRYESVKLYYDLTSDAVIISNYQHDDLMLLDPEKIDSFSIGKHSFIHLPRSNGLPKNGFYEQLYAGSPGLYVRREKKFYFGTGHQENRYVERNNYFIFYNNIFYPSDSKTEMLTVFSDQGDRMKKFIHNSKPDFKEDYESALLACVIYYAGLKHP